MKSSTPAGSDTVRAESPPTGAYAIGLKNGSIYNVIEVDLSPLSTAIARANALHAANPGNTYGVFQTVHTKNGTATVQVA